MGPPHAPPAHGIFRPCARNAHCFVDDDAPGALLPIGFASVWMRHSRLGCHIAAMELLVAEAFLDGEAPLLSIFSI